MPYISEEAKERLEIFPPERSGELNYVITKIIESYTFKQGLCYNTINEIIGVLECVKQEYYRRVVIPYEEKKKQENGDVYSSDITG